MTELEKARQTINDVDKQMAELFEQRMDAARIVAEYKKENGLKI
ncbi:MAG: chorismate mutase, partial [Clostridia bacterium]|nr:chorismate mutase [Clostridia bacterium]